MSIVEAAEKIARKAHQGQMRKWTEKTEEFIVHPIRVAEKVKSLNLGDVAVAAAYLHDVIEDCGDQWAKDIEEQCGKEVLDLVNELTFPTDKPEFRGMPRAEKNKIRFAKMAVMTEMAKRIKLVDRLDNVCDMKCAPLKMKQKYIPESAQLVDLIGYVDVDTAKELKEAIHRLEKSCR